MDDSINHNSIPVMMFETMDSQQQIEDFQPRKRSTSVAYIEEVNDQNTTDASPDLDVDEEGSTEEQLQQSNPAIEEGEGEDEGQCLSSERRGSVSTSKASLATARAVRRRSFIESLPVVLAEPELPSCLTGQQGGKESTSSDTTAAADDIPIVMTATEVIPITSQHGLHGNGRPSRMSVKVHKPTLDTKLGIRFRASPVDGRLQIAHIIPDGLVDGTQLCPGDFVTGLDGIPNCSKWTPARAVAYLKECIGYVTIVANNPFGDSTVKQLSICKTSSVSKLGISMDNDSNSESGDLLRITHLNKKLLVGDREALLEVGDFVERINGIDCSKMNKSLALSLIRESPKWVTIDARTPSPDRPQSALEDSSGTTAQEINGLRSVGGGEHDDPSQLCHLASSSFRSLSQIESSHELLFGDNSISGVDTTTIIPHVTATEFVDAAALAASQAQTQQDHVDPAFMSVTATKTSQADKLGVALRNNREGDKLIIARLTKGGLLSESPLKTGMTLLSINHTKCDDWDASRALQFLRASVGPIHLIAYDPDGDTNYVLASAVRGSSSSSSTKESSSSPLIGVSFRGSTGTRSRLKLCDIRADGLFGNSVLDVGDTVVAINDMRCQHLRPKEAVDIVKHATSPIMTILSRRSSRSSNIVVVSCTAAPPAERRNEYKLPFR